MKLYDIPAEALNIESELEANAGELTPDLERRIAAFLRDGKEKIESAAIVVRSLEADAAFCKEEAKRLMQRAAGLEKSAERLEGLMIFALDDGFGGKIKTAKFTIWAQNSAPTMSFEVPPGADIGSLPEQFLRQRDPELNCKALEEAVDKGSEIPEIVVVTEKPGTRFLRIK